MSKKIMLKTFNKELIEFFNFIYTILPTEEIECLNTFMTMFIKYNPTQVIYLWEYYVAKPYIDDINKGQLEYFENKDYSNDVRDLKEDAQYVLESYNNIKNSISKLDKKIKKKTMGYVQRLSKLSLIYYK